MKAISVFQVVAFTKFKSLFAYRSSLLISFISGPIYFFIQYSIWSTFYSNGDKMNGLTLEQMITYFGIIAVINYVISDSIAYELPTQIQQGDLSSFLIRPVSYIYFSIAQKAGARLVSLILEFVPILLLFSLIFKVNLIPANPFWFVISIVFSFLLMFFVNFILACAAFKLTAIHGMRLALESIINFCSGMIIPLSLFPMAIQKILFFLPFQYIIYVPVRVFLGSYELAGLPMSIPQIVFIQGIAVLVMALLASFFWRLGIRKFTGVGS